MENFGSITRSHDLVILAGILNLAKLLTDNKFLIFRNIRNKQIDNCQNYVTMTIKL